MARTARTGKTGTTATTARATRPSRSRPPMRPKDIRHQVVVEELGLAPDGDTAVVVRRTIQGDRYHGHILAIALDSAETIPEPRTLTSGAVRDTKPQVS